jgi:hypothetical protein
MVVSARAVPMERIVLPRGDRGGGRLVARQKVSESRV